MAQEIFLGNIRGPANKLTVGQVQGTNEVKVTIDGESPNQTINFDIPRPYISTNNHWFVNGQDTGISAIGLPGQTIMEISGTIQWPNLEKETVKWKDQLVETTNCPPIYYKTYYSGQISSELKKIDILNGLGSLITGKYCNLVTITPSNINAPEDNFYPIQYVFGVDTDANLRNPVVAFRSTTKNNIWNNWSILNKGGGGGNSKFDLYDLVITSQAEFDNMIADPEWNLKHETLPPQRILLFQDPTKIETQDWLILNIGKNLIIPPNIAEITALGRVVWTNQYNNPDSSRDSFYEYNGDEYIISTERDFVSLNNIIYYFTGLIDYNSSLITNEKRLSIFKDAFLNEDLSVSKSLYVTTTGIHYNVEGSSQYKLVPRGLICFRNCHISGNFASTLPNEHGNTGYERSLFDNNFQFLNKKLYNEENIKIEDPIPQLTIYYNCKVENTDTNMGIGSLIKAVQLEQCNNCSNLLTISYIEKANSIDWSENMYGIYIDLGTTTTPLQPWKQTPIQLMDNSWFYPIENTKIIAPSGTNNVFYSMGKYIKTHYKGITTTPLTNGSKDWQIIINGASVNVEQGDEVTYNNQNFVYFSEEEWSSPKKWVQIAQTVNSKSENINVIKATGSTESITEEDEWPLEQGLEVTYNNQRYFLANDGWHPKFESDYIIGLNSCSDIEKYCGEVFDMSSHSSSNEIPETLKAFECINLRNCTSLGLNIIMPPLDYVGCFNVSGSTFQYMRPKKQYIDKMLWNSSSDTNNYDLKINSGFALRKLFESKNWYGASSVLIEADNVLNWFVKATFFAFEACFIGTHVLIPPSVTLISTTDDDLGDEPGTMSCIAGKIYSNEPNWIETGVRTLKFKHFNVNLEGGCSLNKDIDNIAIIANYLDDCEIMTTAKHSLKAIGDAEDLLKKPTIAYLNNVRTIAGYETTGDVCNYDTLINCCGQFTDCKNMIGCNGILSNCTNIFGFVNRENLSSSGGHEFITEYKNCDTIIGGKGKFINCKNLFGCVDENNQPINHITSVDDGQGNLIIS